MAMPSGGTAHYGDAFWWHGSLWRCLLVARLIMAMTSGRAGSPEVEAAGSSASHPYIMEEEASTCMCIHNTYMHVYAIHAASWGQGLHTRERQTDRGGEVSRTLCAHGPPHGLCAMAATMGSLGF